MISQKNGKMLYLWCTKEESKKNPKQNSSFMVLNARLEL